jgi:hypothetical protein
VDGDASLGLGKFARGTGVMLFIFLWFEGVAFNAWLPGSCSGIMRLPGTGVGPGGAHTTGAIDVDPS